MEQNSQPENLQPEDSIKMPEPEMPEVKKSKAPLIGMILLGALAVAGVTFGIISLINANNKSAEIEELNAKVNLLQQETGTQITEKDGTTITVVEPAANQSGVFGTKDLETRTILAELKATLDAVASSPSEYAEGFTTLTIFEPLKTATDLDKAYGFKYADINVDEARTLNEKSIEKLVSLGFVKNEKSPLPDYLGGDDDYINPDSNILCSTDRGVPFNVVCGYYKWVNDDVVTLVNQLAEAYKNKEGNYPGVITLRGDDSIKNSSVSPYQTMNVALVGGGGWFYRVSPDSEWLFFTGGNAPATCDEYNTQDLKNAFAGTPCDDLDTKSMSTVQP